MFRIATFRAAVIRIIRARSLRRFAPHLLDRSLWTVTPRTMGMGVAIGFFFAFLIPVGQIFLAVALAVILRGNLLMAASSTFITNPLTFPPIYYLAWKVGCWLLSWLPQPMLEHAEHLAEETPIISPGLASSVGAAGAELALGLVTLAILAAPLGYLAGWAMTRAGINWREHHCPKKHSQEKA